jgi:cystathionine gamma-lyase
MVWFETPTNPLLKVTDIKAVCEAVRAVNKDIIVVVDNTFMTSYFQRPLELGADIEFASVTKYYNGHSDVLMGVTILRDEQLAERLQFIQFAAGAVPGPFDSWLCNRGLKTLHLRMEAHSKNAMACARFLEAHPLVDNVIYPGLESHPGHEVAKKQNTGFSGMLSFRIKGGIDEAKKFLELCKVFTLAESLGAVESLAELPAIMTHASVPADHRAALGITDNLLRLSVGCEDTLDLLEDLQQALTGAVSGDHGALPNPDDFAHIQAAHLPRHAEKVVEQIQEKLQRRSASKAQ